MTENEWKARTERRLNSIETSLQTLLIDDAKSAEQRNNMERRLESIESTNIWIVRLIIGGIISGLIGFIITGGMGS